MADTNAVIAAVVEDHVHHTLARDRFEEAREIYITHLSVAEIAYVFRRLGVKPNVLFSLLSHPKIKLVSSDRALLMAAKYVEEKGLSLSSFTDMAIAYTALLHHLPLLTFDEKLRRRAERLGAEVLL